MTLVFSIFPSFTVYIEEFTFWLIMYNPCPGILWIRNYVKDYMETQVGGDDPYWAKFTLKPPIGGASLSPSISLLVQPQNRSPAPLTARPNSKLKNISPAPRQLPQKKMGKVSLWLELSAIDSRNWRSLRTQTKWIRKGGRRWISP